MKPSQPTPVIIALFAACCLLLACQGGDRGPGPTENAFKVDHRGVSIHGRAISLDYPPKAALAALGQGARPWTPPKEVPTNKIHIYDDKGFSLYVPIENPETKGLRLAVRFHNDGKLIETHPKETFDGRLWLRGATLKKGMKRGTVQQALEVAKLPFSTKSWGYRVVFGTVRTSIFFTGTAMAPSGDDLLKVIEMVPSTAP